MEATTVEKILQWVHVVYFVCVGIVAVASLAIYHLSARVNADKDRRMEAHRIESRNQIARADARSAEANARAEEAEAVASQARLELAKLIEPRTITSDGQDEIVASVKQFAGQRFGFTVYPDSESQSLLRVLDDTLKSAGWMRVSSQTGRGISVTVAGDTAGVSTNSGVFLAIGEDNGSAGPALAALTTVLRAVGIPCRKGLAPHLQGTTPKAILIDVGKKPVD